MSKAVKAAVLGLVIFVTIWVVTLWQWYRSQKPVNSEEVATQLVLLPAGLTLVALLAWWGAARLRQWSAKPPPAPQAAPAAAAPAPDAAAGPEGQAGQAHTLGLLSIVAEALALPEGDEPEQAWSTLQAGRLRPSPDAALQDDDGQPVFTSRMPDLSTEDWLHAHAEVCEPDLPEALLRAMALVEAPLHRLLSALPQAESLARAPAPAAPAAELAQPGPAFLSGVGRAGAGEDAVRRRADAPLLDIQVWVPADWPEAHRDLFVDWLKQHAGEALDWASRMGSGEPRWSLQALDEPEAGWDRLLPRLHELHADVRPRLLLVLAAHSLVDEAGVMALQARGELFTAQHQSGRVPGEAAAGLLLANAAMAPHCGESLPWLGRPVEARRQRSADRSGRPGSDELIAAARQAGGAWLASPDDEASTPGASGEPVVGRAAWWLCDADHRASRASELFEAFQSVQPDGDAMLAVQRIGMTWGDLGVARALVPVALAASVVRQGLPAGGDGAPASGAAGAEAGAALPSAALAGLLQCGVRRWVIPVWPSSQLSFHPAAAPAAVARAA